MSASKLLAIDAGNTNVVFAVFDGDRLLHQWRAATVTNRTADEYAVWLTQLMGLKGLNPAEVGAAIIACVVPQALHELKQLCRRYFACEAQVVGEGLDIGIEVRVERPGDVGADRLVNAIAAHHRHAGWLIVIDFGTATTFDVVADDGGYEGGVIAPGVNLSVEALDRAAAKLPRIAVQKPQRVIGSGTVTAMQSGVYWGYVGLVEGLVRRIKGEIDRPAMTIATGGLAPLFAGATEAIDVVEPDLTLHGLSRLHLLNR